MSSLQNQPMVTASKCPSGKIGYLTRIGAKLALNQVRVRRRRKPGAGEWAEYHCPHCGHWHLTSRREK